MANLSLLYDAPISYIASFVCAVLWLWILGIFLYRLTLHPLRYYPGPLLYRLSGVPVLYHAWRGDLQYCLYKLHHRYGEYVRYSPNKLSINNAKALNDIYGFNKNNSKPEDLYSAFRVSKYAVNTFNTTSKEAHRRKRRIMAKAFSEPVLPAYDEFIFEKVIEFCSKLHGDQTIKNPHSIKEFNMAYESFCIMLDILGGLCFGEAFGFVAGKGDEVMDRIHKRALRIHMIGQEPLLKRFRLDRLFFPQLFKASNDLASFAKVHTFRRIEKYNRKEDFPGKGYQDILQHLLESRDDKTDSVYTDDELLGEGVLLMLAGSDTGSTAINATLFYLVHHGSALLKLRKELSDNFPTADDIRPSLAYKCQYLRACMDEAMRLSPPIPALIPRLVDPGGIKIGDKVVSRGVSIGVPNFTIFRNSRYFEKPHNFIPERWIAGSESTYTVETVKRARSVFFPFSMGPRQCIGKRLAVREITYILAKVLYDFDIECIGDSGKLSGKAYNSLPGIEGQVVLNQFDSFISLESGPVVRLTPRKSSTTS